VSPERWQQIKAVLDAALERDVARRATFLAEVCQGDEALRREIDSLLAAERRVRGFLEPPLFTLLAETGAGGETSHRAAAAGRRRLERRRRSFLNDRKEDHETMIFMRSGSII